MVFLLLNAYVLQISDLIVLYMLQYQLALYHIFFSLFLSLPLFKRIFHVFCLADRANNNKIFAAIFPRIFAYYFHCFSNGFTACPPFLLCVVIVVFCFCLCLRIYLCVYIWLAECACVCVGVCEQYAICRCMFF